MHTSLTVLVVDDEPRLREALRVALELDGYQVGTAATGEQALTCIERAAVDAIVLDVTMPGMTGLEVCRALRKRGDRTPVLLVRGLCTGADQAAGLAAGADDYLTKPFDLDEFLAHLRTLLGTRWN